MRKKYSNKYILFIFILFQALFSFVIAMVLNQAGPMDRLFYFIISKVAVSEGKKAISSGYLCN